MSTVDYTGCYAFYSTIIRSKTCRSRIRLWRCCLLPGGSDMTQLAPTRAGLSRLFLLPNNIYFHEAKCKAATQLRSGWSTPCGHNLSMTSIQITMQHFWWCEEGSNTLPLWNKCVLLIQLLSIRSHKTLTYLVTNVPHTRGPRYWV